jgi:hypothetical protein
LVELKERTGEDSTMVDSEAARPARVFRVGNYKNQYKKKK